MTRLSKQERRRKQSPRKHKTPSAKTGSKKDNLPQGYKEHFNALGEKQEKIYISRIR